MAVSQYKGEIQSILAGSQFDGTQPTTDEDEEYGALQFLPGTAGGLFKLRARKDEDPQDKLFARKTTSVKLFLANQTSWNLYITDGTNDVLLLTGTTETDVVLTDPIILMPYQSLKLVTAGASQAMRAEVTFDIDPVRQS